MKTTYKIAKIELSMLFYSPIAWFLLIVFLFQAGLIYTGSMEQNLTIQGLGGQFLIHGMDFLTLKSFGRPYTGAFYGITEKLYLFIPLLTMGLMSRETSSGTIKLLYSSPIRVRQIVFGKYLAMMLYSLLLIGILAIFGVTGMFNIKSADHGVIWSGLLGLYLLLCAYSAIGLFMSCLTTYQVVAALSTLVMFAALYYIGTVWQDIDFVRDLTYFLSISGRTQNMLGGMITTKDVLYFAVIVFIFLGFSIYKLEGDRESKPFAVKAARYVLIVLCGLAIGYITSRPGLIGYYDATATQSRTLTENAQKIVRDMGDEPLEVTSYINLLDRFYWSGAPGERNEDMARWEPYLRFKPGIKFKYVYYYDSTFDKNTYKYNPGLSVKALAEKYAKSAKVSLDDFLTPAQIRKEIDLRPEQNRYVMQLRYKGKTTFLRLFDDQQVFPSETETSAALKRLQQAKMPMIAFVQSELERSIDKMGDKQYRILTNEPAFRYALVNQGFDVETVSLDNGDIPTGISALVIADPRIAFDTAALTKIRQYIAGGGNLLVTGEAGRQDILNPVLQTLGVQLKEGMLVQESKDYAPDLVLPNLTTAAAALSKSLGQAFKDSVCVSMPGAAALTYDTHSGFDVTPLLMTDSSVAWNKKKKPDADAVFEGTPGSGEGSAMSGGVAFASAVPVGGGSGSGRALAGMSDRRKTSPSDNVVFSATDGDERGSMPTALRLTRQINGKEQRIVVTGDADFLSNVELGRRNVQIANFQFGTALFSWLSASGFPIDTSRPPSEDNRLNLSDGGLKTMKILFLGVLPGLLLAFGTILLIRRKRK